MTRRLEVRDWDDELALDVFSSLDRHDQTEAELYLGGPAGRLSLFAEWRALNAWRVMSGVAVRPLPRGGGEAVAVLGLTRAAGGIAEAAMLARDHRRFRREIAVLGSGIRGRLPVLARRHDLQRIEARRWAGHPTAARFLASCGFRHEAAMRGYGPAGRETFNLFAWIADDHHEKEN